MPDIVIDASCNDFASAWLYTAGLCATGSSCVPGRERSGRCLPTVWRMGPGDDSNHGDDGQHDDGGLALEEARPKLKRPPMYKVVLLNDDYTPMEFVVEILETFFQLDRQKATQVMLHVHTKGKGVCGVFTREIAETKVVQVNEYSRQNQHPLMCDLEQN